MALTFDLKGCGLQENGPLPGKYFLRQKSSEMDNDRLTSPKNGCLPIFGYAKTRTYNPKL